MIRISHLTRLIILSLTISFTSCKKDKPDPPLVSTASVTEISYRSAVSGGNVTSDGGGSVTSRGICWNTSTKPTVTNSLTTVNGRLGEFSSELVELSPNTMYYVRAYATNEGGTGYGNEVTFTTSQIEVPVLTTTDVTLITQTTASAGGNITDDKGANITGRGVCWSTSENPTVTDSKTSDGTELGSFVSQLTSLTGNTVYYLRAYATNSAGTGYGNQISFKTNPVLPPVSTTEVSAITDSTAMSGGNITQDGGGIITSRGVCWSTSANPTIESSKTTDGTGTGSYSSSLTGLDANTTYYVRAYATNIAGTNYGNEICFITISTPVLSILTINSVTASSISTTCSVSSDGVINSKGVCWSTSVNPTISDNKTDDGNGTGNFSSTITGLTGGTTYYLRAYVIYSTGTIYGTPVTILTPTGLTPPTAVTNMATLIGPVAATLNGKVNGFGQSTTVSFEYGTSASYGSVINDSHITILGPGDYSVSEYLRNLKPGTEYHYRVMAESSGGTTYGNDITFSTLNIDPVSFNPSSIYGTVSDIDGNSYKTIQIGTQTWMAENLKTTKYSDGSNIPKPPDGTFKDLTSPGYCWYNNYETSFKAVYGALYNWYALNSASNGGKNVCPVGWHVPSDAEWTILTTYLGGESVAGGKLKETGSSHWKNPNISATNETGFTALPGGSNIGLNPEYGNFGLLGYFWTSTESLYNDGYYRSISYTSGQVVSYLNPKSKGFSVRCLKD